MTAEGVGKILERGVGKNVEMESQMDVGKNFEKVVLCAKRVHLVCLLVTFSPQ